MYDDFPILTNQDYIAINNEYAKQRQYNKTYCANKIVATLNQCKEYYFALTQQANKQLSQALREAKICIETMSANMSTICDVTSNIQEIKQTNIFAFLKNLLEINKLSFEMFEHEEKEYYKKIASANIKLTLQCLDKLLSALENSNFRLFKFM